MAIPQEKYYTIEDIYNLPEGTRGELIDGQIYYMSPSPSRRHQRLISKLLTKIQNYIDKNKGDCEVYPSPFAVYLSADNSIYLEPDISVICDTDKLDDKGCHGAPDWVIEIVSPGSPRHDYVKKLMLYFESGVREYWIVDPRTDKVMVYFFESDEFPVQFTFQDKVKVNIYDDFEIDFASLHI